jgi:hypothetical protein
METSVIADEEVRPGGELPLASDGDDVVAGIRPPDGREEEDWEPKPTS